MTTSGKNGTKQVLAAVVVTLISTVFATLWASSAIVYKNVERRQDRLEACSEALRESNVEILTKLSALETTVNMIREEGVERAQKIEEVESLLRRTNGDSGR